MSTDTLTIAPDFVGEVTAKDPGGIAWGQPLDGPRYSADQPRRPDGKFGSKVGGALGGGGLPGIDPSDYTGGYSPNATTGPWSTNDDLYWKAASKDRLQAIRDEAGVPGTVGNKALTLMDENPPTTVPLYRGVRPSDTIGQYNVAVGPYNPSLYKPGQEVDLQLSSFSTSRDEALAYARNANGRTNQSSDKAFLPSTSALIRVEPGAKALDIGPTFRGNPGNEVITAGRFKVVSVEVPEVTMELDQFTGQGITLSGRLPVITLQQTANIEP
jgi:hypothetical protein